MARLGGDEFAILSIENNQINAESLVNRVLQAFAEANISAAIGLAMRNPLNGLLKTLQEADEKMYEHKKKIKA
ncbi:hypothetical protein D3C80_2081980 [compost metagenome]